MKPLALVTCKVLPEPDPDQELLIEALARRDVRADLLPWDDPDRRPSDYALCVLRSCWNYHHAPEAFLRWIDAAEKTSRLLNPPAVVRDNLHKRYLRGLEADGVPVVPTAFVDRGAAVALDGIRRERGWESVVVKPAVSAGSYRTRRFGPEDGQAFLDALARDRDAMVQPLLPAFDDPGERALVWIDGRLTHAVRKRPRFDDGEEQVSEALPVTPDEEAFARKVLNRVGEDLLYARIDVLPGPVLSELELIEPSLFLLQQPKALDRLVDAIIRRLA